MNRKKVNLKDITNDIIGEDYLIPDIKLEEINDINISNITDGQILKYDGTTNKWINSTGGAGGASALSELTDISLSELTDGDILRYDSENSKWVNYELPISALYETTGQNTDGAMTQKATTDALDNKLDLSGGSITGDLTVSGTITGNLDGDITGNAATANNLSDDCVSIELNKNGKLANFGGFIDFHYNGSSSDYTSRIIESSSGVIQTTGCNISSAGVYKAVYN